MDLIEASCRKPGAADDLPAYDVFNGDADGICALHQLRLAEPRKAQLITGVKRDIRLLDRIDPASPARITVLDVSLDSNRDALLRLLASSTVFYVDHHYAGEIPASARLSAHIETSPETCTSLLVDGLLGGRYRPWALVGAFGDNLHARAEGLAAELGLDEKEIGTLRELGELMNYNGYGRDKSDLHLAPETLYRAIAPYPDPLVFCRETELLAQLRQGFAEDMKRAMALAPECENEGGRIFFLPNEKWARRAAGVFCNWRAREMPEKAHALLVDSGDRSLMVSVRAPMNRPQGADRLCRAFPTGGGRAGAAGINALPFEELDNFKKAFWEVFS